MEMKKCTKCENEFPATADYFYIYKPNTRKKEYLRSVCKTCYNLPRKDRREYAEKVKELKIQLAVDMGLIENPKCKECGDFVENPAAPLCNECQSIKNWITDQLEITFKCNTCGYDRSFYEMKSNKKKRKVEKICKGCYREKHEMYRQNYHANLFVKVLRERRKNNNEESTNGNI
jgi:hypothetical protein